MILLDSKKIIAGLLLLVFSIIISLIVRFGNKPKSQPQKHQSKIISSYPHRKKPKVQPNRVNPGTYHPMPIPSGTVNSAATAQEKAKPIRQNRQRKLRQKVSQKIDRILRIIDEIED